MKKTQTKTARRKGFTIIELVIVIAVIAILAAVLIPTFSSLIRKSNLSADKQAVREMNLALAADEKIHGKPVDEDQAMQVLADAGYNSDNWVPLTDGYKVYYYIDDNRLILYNSNTNEVEYPTEYPSSMFSDSAYAGKLLEYDNQRKSALAVDLSFSSSDAKSNTTLDSLKSSSNAGEKAAITTLSNALSATGAGAANGAALKQALNLSSSGEVYVYASEEMARSNNNGAVASIQAISVGNTATAGADHFDNNGNIIPDAYLINIYTAEGASPTSADMKAASQAAATNLYTLFTQMNDVNKPEVAKNTPIVFQPGITIDASALTGTWKGINEFNGKIFGSLDPDDPVIFDGFSMTSGVGYLDTVYMEGSASKYFMTGVLGTIYGDVTVQGLIFRNLSIVEPAKNYGAERLVDSTGKILDNRNTIGIIGGITDGYVETHVQNETHVTIKNVTVESSCEVVCCASGAGLVGYIGSDFTNGAANFKADVVIENCTVSAKISNNYAYHSRSYGPLGGIVGFTCRADGLNLTIRDCTFDGSVDGTTIVGAAIGDIQGCKTIKFEGNNHFENAKINKSGKALDAGGVIGCTEGKEAKVTFGGTITYDTTLPAYKVKTGGASKKLDGSAF